MEVTKKNPFASISCTEESTLRLSGFCHRFPYSTVTPKSACLAIRKGPPGPRMSKASQENNRSGEVEGIELKREAGLLLVLETPKGAGFHK